MACLRCSGLEELHAQRGPPARKEALLLSHSCQAWSAGAQEAAAAACSCADEGHAAARTELLHLQQSTSHSLHALQSAGTGHSD